MSGPHNAAHPALSATGHVVSDIPCARCGYNLRTRHRSEICPECATSVARSLRADLATFDSSTHLHRLAGAARWLAWSITALTLAGLLSSLPTLRLPAGLLSLVSLVGTAAAVLRLTASDAGRASSEHPWAIGNVVRVLLAALVLLVIVSLLWAPGPLGMCLGAIVAALPTLIAVHVAILLQRRRAPRAVWLAIAVAVASPLAQALPVLPTANLFVRRVQLLPHIPLLVLAAAWITLLFWARVIFTRAAVAAALREVTAVRRACDAPQDQEEPHRT